MPDPRVQQGVQFSGICSKLILEGRSRQQPLFLERGLTACPSVGASSSKHRLDSGSGKGQCSWNENYIDRSKSSATEFPKGLPEPVSSRQRHRWEENRLLPGKIPLLQLLTAFVGAWSMSQREMHRLDWPLQEQVWNLVGKMVSPRFSLLVQSYSPPAKALGRVMKLFLRGPLMCFSVLPPSELQLFEVIWSSISTLVDHWKPAVGLPTVTPRVALGLEGVTLGLVFAIWFHANRILQIFRGTGETSMIFKNK